MSDKLDPAIKTFEVACYDLGAWTPADAGKLQAIQDRVVAARIAIKEACNGRGRKTGTYPVTPRVNRLARIEQLAVDWQERIWACSKMGVNDEVRKELAALRAEIHEAFAEGEHK